MFRHFKASLANLLAVPSWESLSEYWKREILTDFIPVFKKNPQQLCGVLQNPREFLPSYLLRFIMRREMDGYPLAPGVYSISMKVGSDGGRHSWFKWASGNYYLFIFYCSKRSYFGKFPDHKWAIFSTNITEHIKKNQNRFCLFCFCQSQI